MTHRVGKNFAVFGGFSENVTIKFAEDVKFLCGVRENSAPLRSFTRHFVQRVLKYSEL
jgi:hypothetical protein